MDKKKEYFYMRITKGQKATLREKSSKKDMTMTQYIWFLITNDEEK